MPDINIHIGEMLTRNARLYPNDTALVERNAVDKARKVITWKELDERGNGFADVLEKRGVRKGDKVAHWMQNSIDWLVAYFGIVRTGAWVVPLNFRFSAEELKYCADVAEPTVIVFDEEFTARIESVKDRLSLVKNFICNGKNIPVFAESFHALVADADKAPRSVELWSSDPCALYFTSGTTGKPKPILLTHNNLAHAAITECVHHRHTKGDVFVLIPPLYHTGAMMHWLGHVIVGSKAVILKGVSPQWILEALSEESGTVIFLLVPWVQDMLVKLDSGELNLSDYTLDRFRLLHMGAQPIPPALVQHWRKFFPAIQYNTTFGLSEATGPGCVNLGIGNEHKIGAIGLPGFNWDYIVVDDNGNPVPKGQPGELCVRGNGVMREYYKNPEATAKALRDGWLFTGDMVRVDEDGFIWIVDRKKDVIISGGENVFPAEVENFLRQHPAVMDVAAIGVPDERLGEIVAVVIDVVPGKTLTEEEILQFSRGLMKYKRPRKVYLGEVPRNPTGKIEKVKLRKMYIGTGEAFRL